MSLLWKRLHQCRSRWQRGREARLKLKIESFGKCDGRKNINDKAGMLMAKAVGRVQSKFNVKKVI